MAFCSIIVSAVLIIAGWLMWKHCPKKINKFYGYRTKRSMKNMDTWKFAHEYCGKLWWKLGWIMLISSVVIHPICRYCGHTMTTETIYAILCNLQVVVLLISIFLTETALKKKFFADKNTK